MTWVRFVVLVPVLDIFMFNKDTARPQQRDRVRSGLTETGAQHAGGHRPGAHTQGPFLLLPC